MDNIDYFLDYNYKPTRKKDFMENTLSVLFLSVWICLIGDNKMQWTIVVGILNIVAIAVNVFLMLEHKNTPVARHGCDCTLMFAYSLEFLLISYRLQTHERGENYSLLGFLVFLLLLCNAGVMLLTLNRVKKNKYATKAKSSGYVWGAIAGSTIGIAIAKFFFPNMQEEKVLLLTAILTMFLSLVCSVGSVALLKLILQNDRMKQKLCCMLHLQDG